jgi:hypothetical protein
MADAEQEHSSWLDSLMESFSKKDDTQDGPLNISNVTWTQRPMEATEGDIPVGQDELGNTIYKTMFGDRYTVSPAPDQRTTMAKVKQDVIPAVKAYAKNPKLPTGQQVLDTGKAVAVGAYDAMSIPKKLLTGEMGASEVTVGDVLDTTGSMALGSTFAKVPQGALRTFGGRVDKDAPIGTFTTAKGSTYEHFADATTTRNRAARNDSEVSGPQPRSGKTIFMSKKAVNDWGPVFQNTEIPVQLIPLEGNKARLVYLEDYGPKKAGEAASGTFEYTTTPQLGLHPVEIAGSTNTNRRNIHFGNEIVSIGSADLGTGASKDVRYKFAQGGLTTTENQMNKLFAEGGIKDDGMTKDPVSGNEVPPGSMATEVRDDIDARLSEGEYVVPADVVRYFGVAFFEKIRQKAKEGLARNGI